MLAGIFPFLLLVLWLVLVTEVLTGRGLSRNWRHLISRRSNPLLYWISIGVQAAILILFTRPYLPTLGALGLNWPSASLSMPAAPEAAATSSACLTSFDETYGYTTANPIRIGGGDFGGPLRTSAYMQNLRGPNQEPVQYALSGYTTGFDGRLNVMTLLFEGQDAPITVYVDHQSYSEPKAPMGFTCAGPFVLPEP